jgi:hypothetical protein
MPCFSPGFRFPLFHLQTSIFIYSLKQHYSLYIVTSTDFLRFFKKAMSFEGNGRQDSARQGVIPVPVRNCAMPLLRSFGPQLERLHNSYSDFYGPQNTQMTQKRRRNFFFFSAFFRVICGQIIPWGHREYIATSFVAALQAKDALNSPREPPLVLARQVVLPYAKHPPALRAQSPVDQPVPEPVGRQFAFPESAIRCRGGCMFRAAIMEERQK